MGKIKLSVRQSLNANNFHSGYSKPLNDISLLLGAVGQRNVVDSIV